MVLSNYTTTWALRPPTTNIRYGCRAANEYKRMPRMAT